MNQFKLKIMYIAFISDARKVARMSETAVKCCRLDISQNCSIICRIIAFIELVTVWVFFWKFSEIVDINLFPISE